MSTKREYNYDLLRVIAMLAVIVIHVSAMWLDDSESVSTESVILHPFSVILYNTVTRFAVPCFVMLSGAFIMDSTGTENYREFYQKQFKKVGIPTLIFSILYILYRIPVNIFGAVSGTGDLSIHESMTVLIQDIIRGKPFYHMWYLFMLFGVYLLAPIAVRFKNSISYSSFRKVAYIFLIFANFSLMISGASWLNWDFGQSFEYMGYFMIGYVLRRDLKKSNFKGTVFLLLGFAVFTLTAFIRFKNLTITGIDGNVRLLKLINPYSPLTVLASLLVFAGFSMLQIPRIKIIEKLSEMSFVIYLFHAGVLHFISNLIKVVKGADFILRLDSLYWIPISSAIVFLISVLLTVIYNKAEAFICRKIEK